MKTEWMVWSSCDGLVWVLRGFYDSLTGAKLAASLVGGQTRITETVVHG